ncbi:glycosyl hydrolase 115 family protein [Aestuariibaculum suncheonense]|uniref:Glycosyl hydrolase 115 family protein n=1 Tax=Aestuariibaculum suncheonense TaxID=1028745 RepID=A0A8J6QDJ3_9FLAO|nr:glycosyl hydrolase 115 family protein [Aestuariibaculum suncheonense]MBD0835098.1 glycosyl hydrolase 115 family protein [Aestuariibaculum suncheonense]
MSFNAFSNTKYVVSKASKGTFPLASSGRVASLVVSSNEFKGVLKVVGHLQNDIFKVTSLKPNILSTNYDNTDILLIIGTLGNSTIIDELVEAGKIDKAQLSGAREKFITQVIDNPVKGVKKALVIAGSDKRGTIYGIYDLSKQIGVSPWYYWADVPVKKQSELHVLPGQHTLGEPKVKYRGIFINDEWPALGGWASKTFGGFNHQFYDKVFELILRLKGNYLWPAMWGSSFYADDPLNGVLADEYGVVMGTSHHEPLARAHKEWQSFGGKAWNFNTNPDQLKDFWKGGMERVKNRESLITIGMRGDGDEPMTEGTAIELLENIVTTQRDIIEEVTGKSADKTPQVWALYKEVQEYYDQGMKVPDDVTLLLCDDNWGNLRKLPELNAKPRKGGYGIYYHFDYVGGPRSYKWINTNQIERVWEQMNLAYQHDVKELWIVNVGDIKPVEFPTDFFLEYAWNPEQWNPENLHEFYTDWAEATFDGQFTNEIAGILKLYTKYNARIKPELIDSSTYSLMFFNEADKIVEDYNKLVAHAEEINEKLKPEYKDAFYQLVLYPVKASANLNELYTSVAKNRLYASQGRVIANDYANKVQELFDKDAELTHFYHTDIANGKWVDMMSQTHIGYTSWSDPKENIMPKTESVIPEKKLSIGVSVEGSTKWWPKAKEEAVLPIFISYENTSHFVDIFNRGKKVFNYKITSESEWITLSKTTGTVDKQERIQVQINWSKIPEGINRSSFVIKAENLEIPIYVEFSNPNLSQARGFVESDGYISINAENYSSKFEPKAFTWEVVDNLGREASSVISLPVKYGRLPLSESSPKLTYDVYLKSKGNVKVHTLFSPTINYSIREGMLFALGFDNDKPEVVNYDADATIFNYNGKVPAHWHENVSNSIKVITTELNVESIGNHTLNYYRIDEGLVLQKIIIETQHSYLKETYLGPPESYKAN